MKTILKYLLLFNIAFLYFKSYSQKRNIDSLIKLAQSSNFDSIKILNYNRVAAAYMELSELPKADSINEILLSFKNTKFKNKANLHYFFNKGYLFELKGQYTNALDFYFKCLQLAEQEKNLEFQGFTFNSIGIIYFSQNELDKALSYYLKGIEIVKQTPRKKSLGTFYNNVGNIYYTKKDYKKALNYYKEFFEIAKTKKDERALSNAFNNIGSVYLQTNENDKALKCFEEALEIQKRVEDKFGIAYSYINIGQVYEKKKNYLLAEKNISNGLSLSKQINFPDALRDSYNALAGLYENKNEPSKALKYYKLSISFRDSLRNERQLKEINQKEMDNELFRKELILKAENEKQQLQHDEKQKRNKILIFATFFVLMLIIIFLITIYNRYKLTQNQKKVIEEKQKEILDSIRYAKRIQQAILPNEKYIDSKINKNK